MQSRMIVGATTEKRNKYIQICCDNEKIDQLDRFYVEREAVDEKIKASLGIEQIKKIQYALYLTPVKSNEKAVIIPEADLLTIEAQNSLLKILEEPPEHVIFFLSCTSSEAFLPTIRSRCKIVVLSTEKKEINDEEKELFQSVLQKLDTRTIEHPLELAELAGKGREDTNIWLEKLLIVMHESLSTTRYDNPDAFQNLWKTYKTIKSTNANHRLLLEKLFLTYTKIT